MAADTKAQIKVLIRPTGVGINGKNPWDIAVHNEKFYDRALAGGSLGLGEAYMDGWWTSKDLEETIYRLISAGIDRKVRPNLVLARHYVAASLRNHQSVRRAKRNAQAHYDIGNDLYEPMLGASMAYSCGYWKNAKTLDEAQEAKYELICQKLKLKRGMRVLDIGCGWGGLAMYMARKYKVEVTGVTPAREQASYVREHAKGLAVKVLEQDYREVKVRQKFDRVVSVGMAEHIGPKNLPSYFAKVDEVMKNDGIFLLHTIGNNRTTRTNEPWMNKYIFPGAVLPSMASVARACEGGFVIEDMHNFGPDYEKTLLAWYRNFKKAWPSLEEKYGERFYRMWEFYLLSCAAAFKARHIQLWQFVITKPGGQARYDSVR